MLSRELWIFIELSNACIEMLLIFMFVRAFLKDDKCWPLRKSLPFGVLCAGFSFFVATYFIDNTIIIVSCSLLLAFAIAKTAHMASIKQSVMSAVFFFAIAGIAEIICVYIIVYLNQVGFEELQAFSTVRFQGLIATKFLIFLLIKVMVRIRRKAISQLPLKLWLLLMLAPCISLVIVIDMAMLLYDSSGRLEVLTIFSIIGVFFLNILVFFLVENIFRGAETQRRLQITEIMLDTQRQRMSDFEGHQNKIRQITHDMKQHAICIQTLANERQHDELNAYIKSFLSDIPEPRTYYDTGNPAVDAILSTKRDAARAKGIVCDWKILVPTNLPLLDMELSLLLGNALDNAIEACCRTEAERRIMLNMRADDNCLLIEVENTVGIPPKKDGDSFITSKKEPERHGVGLGSMRDCVSRMKGSISLDYDKEVFAIRILLPLGG
jgi:hypothetical protein